MQASHPLWPELWTSLASLLRSYTSLHGLNRQHQATIELGESTILVRIGQRWLRLDRMESNITWTREGNTTGTMQFTIDGRLSSAAGEQEMDLQAEAWARELMQ